MATIWCSPIYSTKLLHIYRQIQPKHERSRTEKHCALRRGQKLVHYEQFQTFCPNNLYITLPDWLFIIMGVKMHVNLKVCRLCNPTLQFGLVCPSHVSSCPVRDNLDVTASQKFESTTKLAFFFNSNTY